MSTSKLSHKMFEWDYRHSQEHVNGSLGIKIIVNAAGDEEYYFLNFTAILK